MGAGVETPHTQLRSRVSPVVRAGVCAGHRPAFQIMQGDFPGEGGKDAKNVVFLKLRHREPA